MTMMLNVDLRFFFALLLTCPSLWTVFCVPLLLLAYFHQDLIEQVGLRIRLVWIGE